MSQSTNLKQSELLNTQINAEEEQDKEDSSRLIEREPIPDTPFYVVGNKEKGYFLTIGKYRITEKKERILDVLNALETEKWNIMMRVIVLSKELIDENQE